MQRVGPAEGHLGGGIAHPHPISRQGWAVHLHPYLDRRNSTSGLLPPCRFPWDLAFPMSRTIFQFCQAWGSSHCWSGQQSCVHSRQRLWQFCPCLTPQWILSVQRCAQWTGAVRCAQRMGGSQDWRRTFHSVRLKECVKEAIFFRLPELPLPPPLLPSPASYNRQSLCLPRIQFKEIEWDGNCDCATVVDRIGRDGADSTRPKKHVCSAHAWEQSRAQNRYFVTLYRYTLPLLVTATM